MRYVFHMAALLFALAFHAGTAEAAPQPVAGWCEATRGAEATPGAEATWQRCSGQADLPALMMECATKATLTADGLSAPIGDPVVPGWSAMHAAEPGEASAIDPPPPKDPFARAFPGKVRTTLPQDIA